MFHVPDVLFDLRPGKTAEGIGIAFSPCNPGDQFDTCSTPRSYLKDACSQSIDLQSDNNSDRGDLCSLRTEDL